MKTQVRSAWNSSLQAKLFFIMAILGFSNLVSIGIASLEMSKMNRSTEAITKTLYPRTALLNKTNLNVTTMAIRIRDLVSRRNRDDRERLEKDLDQRRDQLETQLKDLAAASPTERDQIEEIRSVSDKYWNEQLTLRTLLNDGKFDEALVAADKDLAPLRRTQTKLIDELVAKNESAMTAASADVSRDFLLALRDQYVISFVLLSLGMWIGVRTVRSLVRTLTEISTVLDAGSSQVSSASSQVAGSSSALAQAASEQAASLSQTAAAVEELTSMVQRNNEHSQESAERASSSRENVRIGSEMIQKMVQAMNEISARNEEMRGQIETSNKRMREMGQLIGHIGTKTKIINDIAFQTKILSFNAAVEASRAGEAGLGFSVVADEVGKLAKMSSESAEQINSLLQDSSSKVESIISETQHELGRLMTATQEDVQNGSAISQSCAQIFNEIDRDVDHTAVLAGEISQASQEQAKGLAELNKAMQQLEVVNQQNSATSEEEAAAAEVLSAEATELLAVVSRLQSTLTGEAPQAAKPLPIPTAKSKIAVPKLVAVA